VEDKPNGFLNNVYIFVRNPIDRFFSSYYWLDYMVKNGSEVEKNYLKTLLKKTNIYDIDSHINQYRNFLIECDNFHYIPQSCQIFYDLKNKIYKSEIIDTQTDLKSLYDKNFGLNYKIFKIEDINKTIDEGITTLIKKNIGLNGDFDTPAFNLSKLEFLKEYPNEVSFMFSTFYQYFKNLYRINNHHKNIDYTKKVKFTGYDAVCSLTENERIFFGYGLRDINRKDFKKTLI
jgi:hypothetical protein